jgi:hypothetical protein
MTDIRRDPPTRRRFIISSLFTSLAALVSARPRLQPEAPAPDVVEPAGLSKDLRYQRRPVLVFSSVGTMGPTLMYEPSDGSAADLLRREIDEAGVWSSEPNDDDDLTVDE